MKIFGFVVALAMCVVALGIGDQNPLMENSDRRASVTQFTAGWWSMGGRPPGE